MIYIRQIVAVILAITSGFGCAYNFKGFQPNQKIFITSDPINAEIWIDGKQYGKTPAVVQVAYRKDHIVTLRLDGYWPHEFELTRTFNSVVLMDIVWVGSYYGVVVFGADLITGAIYRIPQTENFATLYEVSEKSE